MSKALIMFHGKAGSGKTTNMNLTKKHLIASGFSVLHLKFADPVYELHDLIQNFMSTYGFTTVKKHRELLQLIGTEVGRKVYGEDVWAQAAMTAASTFFSHSAKHENAAVIIDDCRFPEELDAANVLKDIAEIITITLQAPESVRKERADQWPTNTNHASETSLDEYVLEGKFDLEVHTVGSIEEDFKTIREYIDGRLHIENPAAFEYEMAIASFNANIASIANTYKVGANFGWHYDEHGIKELRILDTAPIVQPSEEMLKQAVAEVPDLIKQAEDLVIQTK